MKNDDVSRWFRSVVLIDRGIPQTDNHTSPQEHQQQCWNRLYEQLHFVQSVLHEEEQEEEPHRNRQSSGSTSHKQQPQFQKNTSTTVGGAAAAAAVDRTCVRVTRRLIRHVQQAYCARHYLRDHLHDVVCELLNLLFFPVRCLKFVRFGEKREKLDEKIDGDRETGDDLFYQCSRAQTMHALVGSLLNEWVKESSRHVSFSSEKRSKLDRLMMMRKRNQHQGSPTTMNEEHVDEEMISPPPPPPPLLPTPNLTNSDYSGNRTMMIMGESVDMWCYLANVVEKKLLYPRNYIHNTILYRNDLKTRLRDELNARLDNLQARHASKSSLTWIEYMMTLLQYRHSVVGITETSTITQRNDSAHDEQYWKRVRHCLVIVDHFRRLYLNHCLNENDGVTPMRKTITIDVVKHQFMKNPWFDHLLDALGHLDHLFHLKTYFHDLVRNDIRQFEIMVFHDRSLVMEQCKQLRNTMGVAASPFFVSHSLIVMCAASLDQSIVNDDEQPAIDLEFHNEIKCPYKKRQYKHLCLLDATFCNLWTAAGERSTNNEQHDSVNAMMDNNVMMDDADDDNSEMAPTMRYFKWKRLWRVIFHRYCTESTSVQASSKGTAILLDDYSWLDDKETRERKRLTKQSTPVVSTPRLIFQKVLNDELCGQFSRSGDTFIDLCSLALMHYRPPSPPPPPPVSTSTTGTRVIARLSSIQLPTLPPSDSRTDVHAKWPPDLRLLPPSARPPTLHEFMPDQFLDSPLLKRQWPHVKQQQPHGKRTINPVDQAAKVAQSRHEIERARLQLLQNLSSRYCLLIFERKEHVPLYERVLLLLDLVELLSHCSELEQVTVRAVIEDEWLANCLIQLIQRLPVVP